MSKSKLLHRILLFVLTMTVTTMNAQNDITQGLSPQQQYIASISALTAIGDLQRLKKELDRGLDAGLTINEIKEVLVQLYAYCGFPRSLNGINTFSAVVEERKAKGIVDPIGKAIRMSANTTDKYEQGRKVLETLTKTPQPKPAPGYGEFAPRIDAFLKEHLFADIFESDVLTYQQRELVTIAALAAMPGVEPQLQSHLGVGMNTGLTENQLLKIFDVIEKQVGKQPAETAKKVLEKVKAAAKSK